VVTHENLADYNLNAGPSDRTFGLVFSGFFLALALVPALRRGAIHAWALGPAALFAACALVRPAWLGVLNRLWTRFGLLLSRVSNPIVLGALFYLVFTPVGICRRLLGSDPLRLRFDPQASSYWITRASQPSSMHLQF
jgi:hypothetical protein